MRHHVSTKEIIVLISNKNAIPNDIYEVDDNDLLVQYIQDEDSYLVSDRDCAKTLSLKDAIIFIIDPIRKQAAAAVGTPVGVPGHMGGFGGSVLEQGIDVKAIIEWYCAFCHGTHEISVIDIEGRETKVCVLCLSTTLPIEGVPMTIGSPQRYYGTVMYEQDEIMLPDRLLRSRVSYFKRHPEKQRYFD